MKTYDRTNADVYLWSLLTFDESQYKTSRQATH
jgi:hypothetical protein